MSTQTQIERPPIDVDDDVLPGPDSDMVITLKIGEGNLDRYLKLVGEEGPRIKYLDGSLTLVSPSYRHERASDRIDAVLTLICDELDIAYISTCSTLYRLEKKDHGVEPDKSYYFRSGVNLIPAFAKGVPVSFDLTLYPPPDLVVETIYGHSAATALEIYQQLGVPEVWLYLVKKQSLVFLQLDKVGEYLPISSSDSFPFLTPEDFIPWINDTEIFGNVLKRKAKTWVREVIAPRHAANPK